MKNKIHQTKNKLGQKFGTLLVIEYLGYNGNKVASGRGLYKVLCDCGQERILEGNSIGRNNKTCGDKIHLQGINNSQYIGGKYVPGTYFAHLRTKKNRNRGKRVLEFNITINYIDKLLEQQEFKCAISGLPIIITPSYVDSIETTASLDRINSKYGYVIGNVQWIHKNLNDMKWELSDEEFISWMVKIHEFNNNTTNQ